MTSQQIRWLAQIAASNARVAGMNSANQQRAITESAPAYSEDHYFSEANEMEAIAHAAGIAAVTGE
jgi:hypothetical protein